MTVVAVTPHMAVAAAASAPRSTPLGGQTLWYLARGSGVAVLLLLTASLALGILTSQRWAPTRRTPRFVTGDLHRNMSLIALVFLFVHIASVVVDGYVPIGWVSAVVPFTSSYRGLWLGLGAVATDLMLAVLISSGLRRRIPYTAWRVVHLTAYACWPIAAIHSFGTGTDRFEGWMMALLASCTGLLACLLAWRALPARESSPPGISAGSRVGVARR